MVRAMANPEHLDRLLDGVEPWNEWRASRDLTEVDLRGADLSGMDLRDVDLWYAKLQGVDFTSANLSRALLVRADLTMADLSHAALYRSDLRGAILDRAVLRSAAMVEADLTLAKVTRAEVDGLIMTGARVLGTNFFGSPIEAVYGLPRAGWLLDASSVPAGEAASIDLRDSMFGSLRRAGAG